MDSAVDDVTFLARSRHRLAILRILADGPADRRTLERATGASRITVGRILGDLTDRHWARSDGDRYESTRLGRLVLEAFDDLIAATGLARDVGPFLEEVPETFVDVDLRHFAGAEVVRTTDSDPYAVARVAAERMRDADRVEMLAHAVTSDVVEAQAAAAADGQTSTVVYSPSLLKTVVADDVLRAGVRDLLDTENVTVVAAAEPIPVSVGIYDGETVGFGFTQDGFPIGGLVTEADAVLAWARRTFERLRREGRELTVANLDT